MMDFVLWYVLIGVALLLFRSDGKIVDAVKADWRPGKRLVLTSLVVLMTVGGAMSRTSARSGTRHETAR